MVTAVQKKIWPTSLAYGLRRQMSSMRPTKNMPAAHARSRFDPATCGARLSTSEVSANARKMPMPPYSAVGFLCQRSGRGLATSLKRRASVRTTNVNTSDEASAMPKPMA